MIEKPRVHFIGIGGIGMSSLARWFLAQNWVVSGSDLAKGAITRDLAKAKGLSDAALVTAFRDAARTMMSQLVQNGQLTQKQADGMFSLMQSHMTDQSWLAMLDMMSGNGWGHMGGMMGSGWDGHGGMMGGWNGAGPRGSNSNGDGTAVPGWGGRGGMMGGRFF